MRPPHEWILFAGHMQSIVQCSIDDKANLADSQQTKAIKEPNRQIDKKEI